MRPQGWISVVRNNGTVFISPHHFGIFHDGDFGIQFNVFTHPFGKEFKVFFVDGIANELNNSSCGYRYQSSCNQSMAAL